jgi:hypothetical protein
MEAKHSFPEGELSPGASSLMRQRASKPAFPARLPIPSAPKRVEGGMVLVFESLGL